MSQCALAVSGPQTGPWFSARFRRQLHAYRAALSLEWSDSTVHPDFMSDADRPASAGQCGATSAWLLHELPWILRVRARYCVGDIVVGEKTLPFHCWIEIGSSAERWVVDVTCDQFESLADREFVCERHCRLSSLGIEYQAVLRLSARQLRSDPVWERAQLLAARMTRWFGRGHWIRRLR
ncbi:hypothetical protein [Kribbella sp. NPDC048915]|uniref:hypothetical protein n=1 Tax=Kribbella sp. NPDC048915 TaxID=3155148 RepID=UPI0033CDA481